MKKIAFIFYSNSTFVEQDRKILEKHFEVIPVKFMGFMDIFRIYNAIKNTDITFSWFGDIWSFFAVLFSKLCRKKSVVVIGGYEVACIPEVKYGICTKSKIRQWMVKFVLNNANEVLPVSNFIKNKCYKYLKHHRGLNVVYNGIDTKYFIPEGKKEDIVLTVASSGKNDIINLKGLDKFVEVAKYIDNIKFIVVGLNQKDKYNLKKISNTNNVNILGKLTPDELLKCYQRAKVYCQLSKIESFGMSLAEAMSCGCIPITSFVGALPEIDGNTGFRVFKNDMLLKILKNALNDKRSYNVNSREHIKQNFSIEHRESKLVNILNSIV